VAYLGWVLPANTLTLISADLVCVKLLVSFEAPLMKLMLGREEAPI